MYRHSFIFYLCILSLSFSILLSFSDSFYDLIFFSVVFMPLLCHLNIYVALKMLKLIKLDKLIGKSYTKEAEMVQK